MEAAFLRGTSNTLAMGTLQIGIASVLGGLLLAWLAWVMLNQYQLFGQNRESLGEAGANVARAMIVATVLIVVLLIS